MSGEPTKPDTIEQRMREAGLDSTGGVYVLHHKAAEVAREWHAERTQALRDLVEGLERLLVAYRTGARPSEATFKKIEKARAALKAEEASRG